MKSPCAIFCPWIKSFLCVRGVISPLLSNILLTPFDQEMRRRGYSLTRYADDSVPSSASARTHSRNLPQVGGAVSTSVTPSAWVIRPTMSRTRLSMLSVDPSSSENRNGSASSRITSANDHEYGVALQS